MQFTWSDPCMVFSSWLLDGSCTCMNCKYGHLQIYISCRSLQKGIHNILKCKHFSWIFFSCTRGHIKMDPTWAVHCCRIGPKFIFLHSKLQSPVNYVLRWMKTNVFWPVDWSLGLGLRQKLAFKQLNLTLK